MGAFPDRPVIGVGVVVLRGDEVLLIKRGTPPALGQWSLPGGKQELGETVREAAHRELMEETGIAAGELHFLDHVDAIVRDGDGRLQFHYTILDFAARWVAGEPVAGGDAAAAVFMAEGRLTDYVSNPEVLRMIGLARAVLG